MHPHAPNPYAPPQAAPAFAVPGGPFSAWLEGTNLAVQKEAQLPDVCVKCGTTRVDTRRSQNFVWNPPWIYVLLILSWLIALIVMLAVQKRGHLSLPLCSPCASRWKTGVVMLVLAILWFVASLVLGLVAIGADEAPLGAVLMVSGLAALIGVGITNRGRFLQAKRIDDRMIVLAHVHPTAVNAILQAAQGAPGAHGAMPMAPGAVAPAPWLSR